VGWVIAAAYALGAGIVVAGAPDRFTVKSPNGIAFAELGNATIVKASKDGVPGNGKPLPDGSMMAKVEWEKVSNTESPYDVSVPGKLNDISFMMKAAKRFPETDGWGYAQFRLDQATGAFKAWGDGPKFAKASCHQCHISGAKAHDFVFTAYAPR
jgi:hypothetical protein